MFMRIFRNEEGVTKSFKVTKGAYWIKYIPYTKNYTIWYFSNEVYWGKVWYDVDEEYTTKILPVHS